MFDELKRRLKLDITPANLCVRAEQMNALIATRPSVIGVSMLMALLMGLLMWDWIDHTLVLGWMGALYIIHFTNIADLLRFPNKVNTMEECKRWQWRLLRSYVLIGTLWGSAAFAMLIPSGLVQQTILVCVLIGMTAGGVAGNPTFLLAQQSYAVLVTFPLIVSLLLQGDREHLILAVMVSAFLAFITKSGRDQCRNEEISIRQRFENLELLESLKHASQQLKVAQHAAQAGFWEWDTPEGRMIWSEELFLLFGMDAFSGEASYEVWRGLIHPDDRERAENAIADTLMNGVPLFQEYRIVLPDGIEKWIVTIGDSIRDEQGKTSCMMGLCFDNTAQRKAQHRALQAESRYQALVEQAGSGFLVHDLDGHIREVNRHTCDMLGYGRDELLQMNLTDIVPHFDLAEARTRWARLESGSPVVFNDAHRRKDGSVLPVEVRLSCIRLDERKMVMALSSDISERIRFEKALQQSEERYRNFAEKLPLGITVLQDGLVRYVNQSIVELLGYQQDELLGKPFAYLIYEQDRPFMVDLHRRRMMGEDVPRNFNVRMVRKDGAVRQWEMHGSTTEWDGKRSSLAIVADITERVAMEEALRNSLHQLEVKELAKTRFLAAAGHDLRQPVAAANLFLDALKNTPHSTQQAELISRLDQSMKVFSELLERLLNISRFDAGLVKPQIVSLDLAELFGWLEQTFAENALNRGIGFRIYFPLGRPLIVRTDIGLLQSVMMNLISNAIKYTTQGGILVAARPRGGQVLLQVWDTGCGISEANIGKVFDEFFQVGNPQRNREAGLGLGLSIAQRAMALLGGRIACRSRQGSGSVFEAVLPLDLEHFAVDHVDVQEQHDTDGNSELIRGKRIVVLEDDSLVAEGFINLLSGRGAEVIHFSDAERALQRSDVLDADYFVVDYSLGSELTGIAFLNEVQRRAGRDIRGVIVTGETSSHFIEGIANLPWPVLHKPVNYNKLARVLGR